MLPTIVQSKVVPQHDVPPFDPSHFIDLDSPVTVGNTVIVHVFLAGAIFVSSLVDNQGNTYEGPYASHLNGNADRIEQWIARNVASNGGTFTITVTLSAGFVGPEHIGVLEVKNLGKQPAIEALAFASGNGEALDSGSTVTTRVGPSLAVGGAVLHSSNDELPLSVDSPFTELLEIQTAGGANTVSIYAYEGNEAVNAGFDGQVGWGAFWVAHVVVYRNTDQVLEPDGTTAAGNWTADPSGTLHANVGDNSNTTYDELDQGADPSTMILDLPTLTDPIAGDGKLIIRARRID